MTNIDPYSLLTRAEVAQHLRCTVTYISELTISGALYSVKVGKKVLIPRAALEAFIRGEPQPNLDGNWPGTPPLFPVDSDTKPCCGGIGRHTAECPATRRDNGIDTDTDPPTDTVSAGDKPDRPVAD